MATVHLDTLRDLSLEEDNDVVISLRRTLTVTGVSGSDHEILYNALSETNVPDPGDELSNDSNMILLKRNAHVVGKNADGAIVEIDIEYSSRRFYVFNTWKFEIDTNMQGIRSQNDRYGNQIIVSHTYPNTDPQYAGYPSSQGGWIDVLTPSMILRAAGNYITNRPDIIARQWIGAVNSSSWAAGAAGTWLCSSVKAAEQDNSTSPPTWRMDFEFQHDQRGWQPAAVYIDPRTGSPPANVVNGVGIVTVQWYPELQFRVLFNIV